MVTGKHYVLLAHEGQHYQLTTSDGKQFYTNLIDYARVHAGERVSCLAHGRHYKLGFLPAHIQSSAPAFPGLHRTACF